MINKVRISLLFFALMFSFLVARGLAFEESIEIYYPEGACEYSPLSGITFVFKSNSLCSLKIYEAVSLAGPEDISFYEPFYAEDVSGKSFHAPNCVFRENATYCWLLEGICMENNLAVPIRSEKRFFKTLFIDDMSAGSHKETLLKMLYSFSRELEKAEEEGFVFTGLVKINGFEASERDIIKILESLISSKRKIVRERVR